MKGAAEVEELCTCGTLPLCTTLTAERLATTYRGDVQVTHVLHMALIQVVIAFVFVSCAQERMGDRMDRPLHAAAAIAESALFYTISRHRIRWDHIPGNMLPPWAIASPWILLCTMWSVRPTSASLWGGHRVAMEGSVERIKPGSNVPEAISMPGKALVRWLCPALCAAAPVPHQSM